MPSADELRQYVDNRRDAAEKFCVSEKTIMRWFVKCGLYEPKANFGCGKLNMNQAKEIRQLFKAGVSIKELANEYKVTPASIGRVVNNITYKGSDVAEVSVIYNPDVVPVATIG
jgi:transposase